MPPLHFCCSNLTFYVVLCGDFAPQTPKGFEVGQHVFIKAGPRPKPEVYEIHKALEDGQYQLLRKGAVVKTQGGSPEIHDEENLVSGSLVYFFFAVGFFPHLW